MTTHSPDSRLVIADFAGFTEHLGRIFHQCRSHEGGKVADYIPQLACVDPNKYALGVCTIDGQRAQWGDCKDTFCVQSAGKPLTYALALELLGEEGVHAHVGREPSGKSFNALSLNDRCLPHNPMINAGAIACCSLIAPDRPIETRMELVKQQWCRAMGGAEPGFDEAVYLSEKATADRNFALAYFMREKGVFPAGCDVVEVLDFYFRTCALTVTADQMAVVAATLASGGVCPVTAERVFSAETVKDCLSLMYSCGMYDFSGEFAFTVGLPAKSGVSGALMLVVPGIAGLCVWSPPLDRLGNPVRGLAFARDLVSTFAFHAYAGLVDDPDLIDPRRTQLKRSG